MRGRSGCGPSIDRVQARVDMCLPSDRSIPSYTAAMMGLSPAHMCDLAPECPPKQIDSTDLQRGPFSRPEGN